MRIIGGHLKGRKLHSVGTMNIRPTSDYLRESIFNILADDIKDATVLDLFAGTGSLGIEALSRGASKALFVDNQPRAIRIISRNVQTCQLQEQSKILKWNILRGLRLLRSISPPFDIVFMDPPYRKNYVVKTLHLLHQADCIADNACIVIEHSIWEQVPKELAGILRTDQRNYGNTLVSFYTPMV
nr:16S rRNA (guanine(966)-N(2))-methyltransferase RsmD [Desulfobacterales bacterium]